MSKRDPEIFDGDQALLSQPFIGHRELCGVGAREMPRSVGAAPRRDRLFPAHTHFQEVTDSCPASAPLYPVAHPHTASDPVHQNVKVDPVKEFLHIQVDGDSMAVLNEALDLLHRSVSGSPWPMPKLESEKFGSSLDVSTCWMACEIIRSRTVGIFYHAL